MKLLEIAAMIGIDPLTFWNCTPGEITIMIHAHNEKRKHDHDEKLLIAYLTAYWQRIKRMPSIKEVLGQHEDEKKEQTVSDMLDEIKKLNAALGGTVY